jgi:hypothetical protein
MTNIKTASQTRKLITQARIPKPKASTIECGEMVEWHVWDLKSISSTISAASVKYTRENNILHCVFHDLDNKIVLRVDASQFTQKMIQPMGIL